MKFELFNVAVLDPAKGLEKLNQFLSQQCVVSVDKELVKDGSAIYWTFLVCYTSEADDVVCWSHAKEGAQSVLFRFSEYLGKNLKLALKDTATEIKPTTMNLVFCGFKIGQRAIQLTKRRKRKYVQNWKKWKNAFERGLVSELELQKGYQSILATTLHADASAWRRKIHQEENEFY